MGTYFYILKIVLDMYLQYSNVLFINNLFNLFQCLVLNSSIVIIKLVSIFKRTL